MPPNSKGGAFIHDPKLARESDVKAQIKLKFRSVQQQSYIVARSIQLTLKKAKCEQKTLESLLCSVDPKTGEQLSMSSRVADVDAEVPSLMGVSRAILDNVVFCHQEDASWPLSEPSVLKKKFDDIFSATRYTKALEQFKNIRKDQTNQIKGEAQHLEFLKKELDRSKKIVADRELTMEKVAHCETKIAAIDAQLERVIKLSKEKTHQNVEFARVRLEFERITHEKKSLRETIDELLGCTKLMTEPTEQLLALVERHSNKSSVCEQLVDQLRCQRDALQLELLSMQKAHASESSNLSFLQMEQESNNKKTTKIQQQMLKIASEVQLECLFDLSYENASRFLGMLKERISFKSSGIYDLKLQLRKIESDFFGEIQKSLAEQAEITESKRLLLTQEEENKQKLQKFTQHLEDLDLSDTEQEKENYKKQFEASQQSIESANQYIVQSQLEDSILRKKNEILMQQQELSDLNSKISAASKYASIKTEYDLKCADLLKKANALQELENDLYVLIRDLLGSNENDSFDLLERHFYEKMKCSKDSFDSAQNILAQCRSSVHSISLSLSFEKDALEKNIMELDNFRQKFQYSLNGKNLHEAIDDLRNELKTLNYDSMKFFKSLIQNLEQLSLECSACPMCERNFACPEEKAVLLAKMENFVNQKPDLFLRKNELELNIAELEKLIPNFEEMKRLESFVIPQHREKLAGLENELQINNEKLSNAEIIAMNMSEEQHKFANIVPKIESLKSFKREYDDCEAEKLLIERNTTFNEFKSLPGFSTSSIDSLCLAADKVKEKISSSNEELKNVSDEFNDKMKEINRQKEISLQLLEKIAQIKQKLDIKQKLEQEITTCKSLIDQVFTQLPEINEKISQLSAEIETKKARKLETTTEIGKAEAQLQSEVIELKSISSGIESLAEEIQNRNFSAEIEALQICIKQKDFGIIEKKTLLDEISDKITAQSRSMDDNAMLQRTVADNLKLRNYQQRFDSLQKQYDSISKGIEGVDHFEFEQQLDRLKKDESNLYVERNRFLGELHTLNDQIRSFEKTINSEYHEAPEKYQAQFVKVKTIELACSDLEKYCKALDAAIMKYHSLKMEEINRIIQDLWTSTYQGSDIDTIEIRSDHEESATAARTYNYRVRIELGVFNLFLGFNEKR